MTPEKLLELTLENILLLPWQAWTPLHEPTKARRKGFEGHDKFGVYQLRNRVTGELILAGIGDNLVKRMRSLYPAPFGSGTRDDPHKRNYVLEHWREIDYRTLITADRWLAKFVETALLAKKNHRFNS